MVFTYAQQAIVVHARRGETQAEAVAKMADARIVRGGYDFCRSLLRKLGTEAAACTSQEDYTFVRTQVDRVSDALRTIEGAPR